MCPRSLNELPDRQPGPTRMAYVGVLRGVDLCSVLMVHLVIAHQGDGVGVAPARCANCYNPSQRAWVISQLTTLKLGDIAVQRARIAEENDGVVASTPLSTSEAAVIAGVEVTTVKNAKTVRERGTTEEKEAVAKGEVGVRTVADKIRARDRKPKRVKPKPQYKVSRPKADFRRPVVPENWIWGHTARMDRDRDLPSEGLAIGEFGIPSSR